MATCLDIVTDALKLARVIASGETPGPYEAGDGLSCLQSLYDSWVHRGMFGTLEDIYLDSDDIAEEGKRYYVPGGFTLTEATNDYVTNCNETRQPRDLALYESLTAAGTRTVKLYDRTAWVDMLGLEPSSAAPLSNRDRMGLAACLATYGVFGAMFGDTATMNPDVRKAASYFLGSLSAKQGSTQDRSTAEYY